VNGSGGLNDFRFSYGYSFSKTFRMGASASILFGAIDETETNLIDEAALVITEENHYAGFRFDVGLQYDVSKRTSVGLTTRFPTYLTGSQSRIIETIGTATITSREEDNDLEDFELPLEFGVGIVSRFMGDALTVNADYQHSFWEATEQRDYLGEYVDQHMFGLGLSYQKNPRSLRYWERVFYRAGVNYDSGNLSVNDSRVKNYTFSAGVGLPISLRTNSMLNISYSYGQKGRVSNGLIQENFHMVTLNFSFDGKWFIKRKYD
jgi:opacity protein-like surface antigen